jgi:hypothetical protein
LRCASVWDIYFSKCSLLWDSPLSFILEGVMLHSLFYAPWLEHIFSMLLEHFFNDPSLLLQEKKSLWTLE